MFCEIVCHMNEIVICKFTEIIPMHETSRCMTNPIFELLYDKTYKSMCPVKTKIRVSAWHSMFSLKGASLINVLRIPKILLKIFLSDLTLICRLLSTFVRSPEP